MKDDIARNGISRIDVEIAKLREDVDGALRLASKHAHLKVPTVELVVERYGKKWRCTGTVTGVRRDGSKMGAWSVWLGLEALPEGTVQVSGIGKTEEQAIAKAKKAVKDLLTPAVKIKRIENGSVCR